MSTQHQFDTGTILASVEEYFDALPATRRRRRTRAEINADYDITPEGENYGEPIEPPIVIELDADAQAELLWMLGRLGRAKNDAVARMLIVKVLDVLGLKLEGGAA